MVNVFITMSQMRSMLSFKNVGYRIIYIYYDYTHTGIGKAKRETAS